MIRKNPFDGKSKCANFTRHIYKRLMSSAWFTHADVMADSLGLKSAAELPCSITCCDHYGELKKAFSDVIKLLKEKVGSECIETRGNNRNKEFRYVGTVDDPLNDYLLAAAKSSMKIFAQFCKDSAGFFPRTWLEYFLEDTLDLLKIELHENNGVQMVSSSIDRELKNIHLLPVLYEAIRDKRVLTIDYRPFEKDLETLTFHPHLLREHNGRWFLFGHAEGKEPKFGYNLALDRIEGGLKEKPIDENYINADKKEYKKFFSNIVGVSHEQNLSTETIIVRATDCKIFNLIETKKIHKTQHTVKQFADYEDGKYGEFKFEVEPNKEFIGTLLGYGEGLVVMSPDNVREMFRQKIVAMHDLYRECL